MPWTEPKPWWKNRFKRLLYLQVVLHCAMSAVALYSIIFGNGMPPVATAIQLVFLWIQMAIHVLATNNLGDHVRELHRFYAVTMDDHTQQLQALQRSAPRSDHDVQ
jgi:hypothetical protein